MSFRKRLYESKILMSVATMCMIAGIVWPSLFHPATQLGKNLSHSLCGMLLGFSITANLGAAWMKGCQSRCGGKHAPWAVKTNERAPKIRFVRRNRGWTPVRAACQVSDIGRVRERGRCENRTIFSS
jgi:hypothetical protein